MELLMKDIVKKYGDKEVLKGISLCAKSGHALGVLGRNGAGKTTTIRILLGLISANEGQILIDGEKINYQNIRIGYLPEERGLYTKKTVFSQLVYMAELRGMKRCEAEKSVKYWLNRMNISEYEEKMLGALSKGNQQKVQLITALVHNPNIVILDEPFSGLDPVNSLVMKEIIREEQKKDKIVLFSSHQMAYVEEFCDEVVILNNGYISASGNIRDIKKKNNSNKILVKSSDANLILEDYPQRGVRYNDEYVAINIDDKKHKNYIIRELAEKYDIDEIKVYEPSLNDIFIEYAMGE